MKYYSTRDKNVSLSAAEAVKMGLSRDGGLLTPTRIPQIDRAFLERLIPMEYAQRAAKVMALYLTDYSEEELLTFGRNAYGPAQFDDPIAAPVRKVEDGLYCLELWHGPTSAFKDMALQMLPQLLSAALRKTGEKRTACILAATSGDTGKAAMAGFADVPQTCIQVYYPKDGVSPVQERQMVTQEGENVDVRAVIGNFDDAQAGVKRIFSDEAVRAELDKRGYFLSSANSINWGRILPQVVYYISAYCDLMRDGALTMGDKVNFCVPTGNFDRNRPFHTTISPSMDILISSNLERLLFDLSGENDAEIRMYMDALGSAGRYQVSDNIKAKLDDAFWGGCCSEEGTEETIRRYWQDHNYLIDPHTAVAAEVLAQYRVASGDETPAVVVSTASPYKFCGSVLTAIGETPCGDGLELLDQLHAVSGVPVPCRLAELKGKSRRFDKTVEKQAMEQAVLDFLK